MVTAIQNLAVQEFGELFLKGAEYLLKACKVYVKTIDNDPASLGDFEEAYPDISSSAWRRFEAVGRGSLHVKLLTNMTTGAKKLEKCSYTEQTKYIEKPIEVLLVNGDTLKVDIHNLQPSQLKQVFASDHVRTTSEQKAYIESLKSGENIERVRKAKVIPYSIVKGKLIVGEVSFTKSDLLRILMQLEK
jgi:hypothetical protein